MVVVDKPPWVSHNGESIFSVHCSPQDAKLATGGGDHSVRIWDMNAIRQVKVELKNATNGQGADRGGEDEAGDRLLATLSDHAGPVNCVRFSNGGSRLASGADDHVCCVYAFIQGSGVAGARGGAGSQGPPGTGASRKNTVFLGSSMGGGPGGGDCWRRICSLRGHDKNIADLAWSADDKLLATASLDTKIIIWDVDVDVAEAVAGGGGGGRMLRELSGHTSFVKGVAWDPVGRYISSQSDDKSLVVWSTETWRPISTMKKSFTKTLGNNYSLRMAWSPDGATLVAANAYSKPKHTAACFSRTDWQNLHEAGGEPAPAYHLVGHKAPVVAACFSPRTFKPDSRLLLQLREQQDATATSAGDEEGTSPSKMKAAEEKRPLPEYCHCVALCSQDQRISIWLTAMHVPLLTIKKPFGNAMVDMCWSSSGKELFVSSLDGTICRIAFDKDELGTVLEEKAVRRIMRQMYGGAVLGNREDQLVQSVDIMNMIMPSVDDNGGAPAGNGAHANGAPQAAAAGLSGAAAARSLQVPPTGAPAPSAQAQQKEVRQSDGRRRIQLVPLGGEQAAPAGPSLTGTRVNRESTAAPSNGDVQADKRRRIVPVQLNAGDAAAGGVGTNGTAVAAVATTLALVGGPSRAAPTIESPSIKRHLVVRPVASNADARVADGLTDADAGDTQYVLEVTNSNGTSASPARTPLGGAWASVVASSDDGSCLWRDRLVGGVAILTASIYFSAAATGRGELQLWARSGRRMAPLLVLGGCAPAFLATDGVWRLLYVGSDGFFTVMDVQRMHKVMRGSVADLIHSCNMGDSGVSVSAMRLSRSGTPLAVMSNNKTFAWHRGLECWSCVGDTAFMASDFTSSLAIRRASASGAGGSGKANELASLQPSTQVIGLPITSSLLSLPTSVQREDTTRHLESLLSSSAILGSWAEFRRWLQTYVHHLARHAEDNEDRLRQFCYDIVAAEDVRESVLGDGSCCGGGACGYDGDECERARWKGINVMETIVIPEILKNTSLQLLVEEFTDIVKMYGVGGGGEGNAAVPTHGLN